MPIYLYEVVLETGAGGERFEVSQKMGEPPLQTHPETGEPVRRLMTPPNIAGQWTERAAIKNSTDDKKLERLGFTKYVKSGEGTYEKTVGKGPDTISK
ncbi:FmdB family zinc ribbon protein [Lignipirellula cremea]|uniref:Zinc ribbon domain protein n=1 Tax=Lignipirellula cremea TaxID=2528010 RepID=A0A518DT18_9BACT|nr:FmdB family transcriptional regulator [Lignipirellula cremea]QDU94977.1 hypothetical protein Pla8534_27860 [Lignipirellula cremea]